MTSATKRLSRVSITTAIAAALALGASVPAFAGPYYLKMGGIDGESTSKDHKGEIDVLSWSWGASNSGSANLSARPERERKESGEKGGTTDINIGVGEMQKDSGSKGGKKGNIPYSWNPGKGERSAPGGKAPPLTVRKAGDDGRPASGDPDRPLITGRSPGSLTLALPAGMCRQGARYPSAQFGTPERIYNLTDVVVTRCAPASSSGDRPMESLTLNYTRID